MSIPHLPELLIILFIVVLIFGAGKLPEIAGSMGKSIKEFRRGVQIEGAKSGEKTEPESVSDSTTDKT